MWVKKFCFAFLFLITISLIFNSLYLDYEPASAQIFEFKEDDYFNSDQKENKDDVSSDKKKKNKNNKNGLKVFVDIHHDYQKNVKLCLTSKSKHLECETLKLSEYENPFKYEKIFKKGLVKKGQKFKVCIFNDRSDKPDCVSGKNNPGKQPEYFQLSLLTQKDKKPYEEQSIPWNIDSICESLLDEKAEILLDIMINVDHKTCVDILGKDKSLSERLGAVLKSTGKTAISKFSPLLLSKLAKAFKLFTK